jgi:hypothetical protein
MQTAHGSHVPGKQSTAQQEVTAGLTSGQLTDPCCCPLMPDAIQAQEAAAAAAAAVVTATAD